MEGKRLSIWVLAACMAVLAPGLQSEFQGNFVFDKYWMHRANEAREAAFEAYRDKPEEATKVLNEDVDKGLEETEMNNTRRELRGKIYRGCMAKNPIDRCWRCKKNWNDQRKRLANCALGFGKKTRGGAKGKHYVVHDAWDGDLMNPRPGTLRHAVIQKEPLWIIFAKSMVINLKQELLIASHKTIDGRGANVHIAYGAGLTIQFAKNVIIHGLYIHDIVSKPGGYIRDSVEHAGFRTRSDGDGISIFGSSLVWLDHLSMRNCADGLIDVIEGSTAVTISNCHFTHHYDVMLLGAHDHNDMDSIMQVTVAFNHFDKGLEQRMPRCRWGFFHVVNNDYTHWMMYAIGGSSSPTILSQGNRFIAPHNTSAKEITHREKSTPAEWNKWTWKSQGDMMGNGAFFVESGPPIKKMPKKKYIIKAKPASTIVKLTRFAGVLKCRSNKKC
ncbi:hypothetical protein SAY86_004181 [Trapa natans]|uniref:Pectate lyase n=1 Tax=Trapa natans TaxID=22666 RepID=A0AAN7RFF9_TRANT|nr:hypothetical protein SAY86_004181 [Trapa natans]